MKTSKRASGFVAAVGQKVKDERERRRWSQSTLAKKLDLRHSAVSRIESGERDIRLSQLYELGRALDVKPAVLVDVEEAA